MLVCSSHHTGGLAHTAVHAVSQQDLVVTAALILSHVVTAHGICSESQTQAVCMPVLPVLCPPDMLIRVSSELSVHIAATSLHSTYCMNLFCTGLAASANVIGVSLGGILGHCMCTGGAVLGGRQMAAYVAERTLAVTISFVCI